MWNRPYIPRLRSGGLPWLAAADVLEPALAGSALRILSADEPAGARSCLWSLPAGWESAGAIACADTLQVFVLAGELTAGDIALREGSYACFEPDMSTGAFRTQQGAQLLLFHDGALRVVASSRVSLPTVIHVGAEALIPTPVDGPPPGIVVKVLRTDARTGGMTLYMQIPPDWQEPRSEHHPCVEESYKLAGEITLEENGHLQTLEAGDYFYRPPGIKHGRMHTAQGTTSIIRFSATPENDYGPV